MTELEISVSDYIDTPPPITDADFADYYQTFNVIMDQFTASVRIRAAMRRKREQIELSPATKARIHHHIAKIREIVDSLDIPVDKKDQILDRLNSFASAVDKTRTDVRQILDVALEVADTGKEIGDKLVDVRKHVNSITGLLAEAREWVDRLGLAWDRPKQIQAPRRQLPPPEQKAPHAGELDDDVPFLILWLLNPRSRNGWPLPDRIACVGHNHAARHQRTRARGP